MSNIIRLKQTDPKIFNIRIKDDFTNFKNEQEQMQDLHNRILEEKYNEGLITGYEKAKLELEKVYYDRLKEKFDEFSKVLKKVDDKITSYEKEFESLVIKISFELASKITRRELRKESGIEITLKESLRKILGANNVIVKLHPEDYEKITTCNDRNKFFDEAFSKMKFESNDLIEKGGCIVETEIGNVDSRISSMLNELKRFFDTDNPEGLE